MAIEWEETMETKRKVRLTVDPVGTSAAGYGNGQLRHATVDDLRRACEAVGLVVETKEEREQLRSDTEACIYALTHQGNRPATVLAGIHSMQRRLLLAEEREKKVEGTLRKTCEDLRMACAAAHDAGWDGVQNAKTLWGFVSGLSESRDAAVAERDDLRARLEKAERLHSEAEAQVECRNALRYRIASLEADLAAAKAEAADTRKEYASLLKRVNDAREIAGTDIESMAGAYVYACEKLGAKKGALIGASLKAAEDLAAARARIAELEAPFEGEPGPETLDALWETVRGGDHTRMLAIWRHGRLAILAELATLRARIAELEAPLPEATVEELVDLAIAAQQAAFKTDLSALDAGRAGIRAVAERVRRERCLIARAVAGGVDVTLTEDMDSDGEWYLKVAGRDEAEYDEIPAAEVPAELARMLTEVGA